MKQMNTNICKHCGITIVYPDMYKRGLCNKHYVTYTRSKELISKYQKKIDDIIDIRTIAMQEDYHLRDKIRKLLKLKSRKH